MKRAYEIFLFLICLLPVSVISIAGEKSPLDVVNYFEMNYGSAYMDEIAGLTTAKFRDNKPKAVWIVETWKALQKLQYKRLESRVIDSKIKKDRAIVVLEAKIRTRAGEAEQKEIYYLSKENETWLIDELIVADEEIDLGRTGL